MFKDRAEAAARLSEKLSKFHNSSSIVLAIDNGSILTGRTIAQRLELPLELILSDDIGHPNNKEYTIGTVCLQSRTLKRRVYVSRDYIEKETGRIRAHLLSRYNSITGKEAPLPLQNKALIIVADSTDQMAKLMKAIELAKSCHPVNITVVVPVLSASQLYTILQEVNEVVYLEAPEDFQSTPMYFENFAEISDNDLPLYMQIDTSPKPLRA
jgi:putative phosphoribosyl transferase